MKLVSSISRVAVRTSCLATGLTALLASPLAAQTYGGYPSTPQTYVISSSPSSDGGTITTTYTAPRSVSVGSTLGPSVGSGFSSPSQVTYSPNVPAYGAQNPPSFDPYGYSAARASYQVPTGQVPAGQIPANQAPSLPPTGFYVNPANLPQSNLPQNTFPQTNTVQGGGLTGYQNAGINPYVGYPVHTNPISGVVPVGYQVANYPQSPSTCNTPGNLPPSLTYQTPGSVGQPYGYGYGSVPLNNNYKPLAPVFSVPNGTYVSQGLLGQPKAYVNNQPVRNIFRYILP